MRVKLAARLGMLGTLAGMNCLGQGEKAGKAAPVSASKLERMPESLEIRFALSAAPPPMRQALRVMRAALVLLGVALPGPPPGRWIKHARSSVTHSSHAQLRELCTN